MATPSNAPELYGTFGQPIPTTHDTMGGDVFADLEQVKTTGTWLDGELRTVSHPLGSAVLYGDCLASDQAVSAALDTALTTNDPKALTHLPGSYTALVFEPERMTALGDLANQYPLYYRQDGKGLAFATSTQPLRESMAPAELDTLTAAGRMAVSLPTDLVAGRSGVKGVRRLDGGHMLTVDRQSGSTDSTAYETFESPDITTIDDAAAVLREALLEAARLRAASGYEVSADFSGGLDSTTAAYLLAQATGKPLPVTTMYTAGAPSADLNQVRRLLALPDSQGLFNPREYVQSDDGAMYAALEESAAGGEPDDAYTSLSKEQAYYRFVREQGGRLHVSGSAADCLFDASPSAYLGDWAKPGSYLRFMRGAAEVARLATASPIEVAKHSIVRSKRTPADDLTDISRILRGDSESKLLEYGGWLFGTEVAPHWLTPAIRKELSDLALARADAVRREPQPNYGNHLTYNALRDISLAQTGSMRRAADMGMRLRAVYMDNPVIRACFSIPASLRVNPWTFKAILVKATEGLIPPEVTQRGTKGDYTPQAVTHMRNILPGIEKLLKHSRLAEIGIIDPVAVQASLDRVSMTAELPWQALDAFAAAERWLEDQAKTHPGSPPPPNIITREAPPNPVTIDDKTVLSMDPNALMVTFGNGAATFQLAKDTYYRHNSNTAQLVETLQECGSFGAVIARYASEHPDVPEATLRAMISPEVQKLLDMGILTEGAGTFSIRKAVADQLPSAAALTRQNQDPATARLRDYPAAIGGFALAMALKRLPLDKQVRTIEHIHRHWAKRPASESSAVQTLAAVQAVAEWHASRAACYELTAATVLAAALKKRRVNLTLGASGSLAKTSFHAWPETNGIAIRTARDPQVAGIFEPLLSA